MFEFLGIVAALSIHALVEQSFRPPAREMRGAWVATVENIDWPSKRGLDRETQRRELESLIQTASNLHLNTLIFQVRPASDCLYRSKLEPWSEYLTGEQGRDPGWDPLQYAIERCHFFGIELHAWFNPYRVRHSGAKSLPAPNHLSRTHPELVCTYAKMLWANPGSSEVQNHTLAVSAVPGMLSAECSTVPGDSSLGQCSRATTQWCHSPPLGERTAIRSSSLTMRGRPYNFFPELL